MELMRKSIKMQNGIKRNLINAILHQNLSECFTFQVFCFWHISCN
jgi:hypothetical protein